MIIEELIKKKADEIERWARENGIIDPTQALYVRMEILQRPPAVSIDLISAKPPKRGSLKTRLTDLPVLEKDWDVVLSLRLNRDQKNFLLALKEGGNVGVKPLKVNGFSDPQPSFSALELINTKLRKQGSSLRLRAIGRGGMYGTRAYKLYHVE